MPLGRSLRPKSSECESIDVTKIVKIVTSAKPRQKSISLGGRIFSFASRHALGGMAIW